MPNDHLPSDDVFSRLNQSTTRMQRRSNFQPPIRVNLTDGETGRVEPAGLATQREYELTLTIVATFWANQAQVADARRVAERSLACTLYHDVIADLHGIMHAASDGDQQETLALLAALEARLRR